ncbi:MAG: NAD(P)H dehydrogenase (quinone), Type IV, partial [uncultured Nocardioidaceae bacterium]
VREDGRRLLLRHRIGPRAGRGSCRGGGEGRRRGAAEASTRAGGGGRDRLEPRLAHLCRRDEAPGRRGRPRGPGVGGLLRLRHAHPVRPPRRAAQAVPRPDGRAVAGGCLRRQAGHLVHLLDERPRRAGVDDPRAEQRLLPLGLPHPGAWLQRPAAARCGRQPLRRLVDQQRRPAVGVGAGGGEVPGAPGRRRVPTTRRL